MRLRVDIVAVWEELDDVRGYFMSEGKGVIPGLYSSSTAFSTFRISHSNRGFTFSTFRTKGNPLR